MFGCVQPEKLKTHFRNHVKLFSRRTPRAKRAKIFLRIGCRRLTSKRVRGKGVGGVRTPTVRGVSTSEAAEVLMRAENDVFFMILIENESKFLRSHLQRSRMIAVFYGEKREENQIILKSVR